MIELASGDLLEANVEALVNPVNCAGVMGRGLAAQLKRAFRRIFARTQRRANAAITETGSEPKWIVNFPTKRHWRNQSRIEDIDAGLDALVDDIGRLRIRSIAVPPLGCGLGGLDWADVRPKIERTIGKLRGVTVMLFEPV